VLARDVAAPEAGHGRRGGLLDHPDVLGLPADLRPDRRRAGELDASPGDIRLPDRRRDRPARRRRRHFALHAAGPLRRRVDSAPISAETRRGMRARTERTSEWDVSAAGRAVRGAEPRASTAGHPRLDPAWSTR